MLTPSELFACLPYGDSIDAGRSHSIKHILTRGGEDRVGSSDEREHDRGMAYAEIVGYLAPDPNSRQHFPVVIDVAQIKATSSVSELYELLNIKPSPRFTLEYVEVRLRGRRYRYTFDGSKWTGTRAVISQDEKEKT